MTANELLSNDYFRHNQTFLAKMLNITRGTLRKYIDDREGLHHHVMHNISNDTYELYTNQTNKIKG